MSYSRAERTKPNGLKPRKMPSQPRSVGMVEAILEAAARILEHGGFAEYSTNRIAERAGVSVGSLYQYFPSKDAVTIALIHRERSVLVEDVQSALSVECAEAGLQGMIRAAVSHQLRRPVLARLLDFEEARLADVAPPSTGSFDVRRALSRFLKKKYQVPARLVETVATNVMEITRALTDAASRQTNVRAAMLERGIEGAILGYLNAISSGIRSDPPRAHSKN